MAVLSLLGVLTGCDDPTTPVDESEQGAGTTTTVATDSGGATLPGPGGHDGHSGGGDPGAVPDAATTRVLTSADQAELAGGFTVPAGEAWELDPQASVELTVSGNVVVEGVLRMRPASAEVEHLLRFTGVDETAFQGGGMEVLESDVGLWVMGNGQLDIQGHERTGWTTLAGGVEAGATSLTLAEAPAGWQVGDEIVVAPTADRSSQDHAAQFDEAVITAIDGATVTVDEGLEWDHLVVNEQWTAEVMNLTRNVRIEGTEVDDPAQPSTDGRAHVLIHSDAPQHIRHLGLRHLGPRTGSGEDARGVLGRYSLHFHHSGEGSRGSIVEGVVVRNSGNSAYVPHASHGITMRDDIAYDGYNDAFWWDPPGGQGPTDEPREEDLSNDSNDLLWEHNIVALLHAHPDYRGYRLAAFTMATGANVTIRDSVAVGVGGAAGASGFTWPEANNHHPNNSWTFENNRAHNNTADGIFVWQNDSNVHIIQGFVAYNNGEQGIEHGAYQNNYEYRDLQLFGNADAIIQHPASGGRTDRSDGYALTFENVATDGPLELESQALGSQRPALYHNCSFSGVVVNNDGDDDNPGLYDFVECGLSAEDFDFEQVEAGTTIRVQDGGSAFQLDASGAVTTIDPFYSG